MVGSDEKQLQQVPITPNPLELPSLPQEQEARIRAFVNMLLDRVEDEQKHGIIRSNHD